MDCIRVADDPSVVQIWERGRDVSDLRVGKIHLNALEKWDVLKSRHFSELELRVFCAFQVDLQLCTVCGGVASIYCSVQTKNV